MNYLNNAPIAKNGGDFKPYLSALTTGGSQSINKTFFPGISQFSGSWGIDNELADLMNMARHGNPNQGNSHGMPSAGYNRNTGPKSKPAGGNPRHDHQKIGPEKTPLRKR